MTRIAALIIVALGAQSAAAQRLAESTTFGRAEFAEPPAARLSVTVVRDAPRDYRWHGLAIGALAFAALGAKIGSDACASSSYLEPAPSRLECAVVLAGVGAVIGAPLGYFLGKGIRRGHGLTGALELAGAAPTFRLCAKEQPMKQSADRCAKGCRACSSLGRCS